MENSMEGQLLSSLFDAWEKIIVKVPSEPVTLFANIRTLVGESAQSHVILGEIEGMIRKSASQEKSIVDIVSDFVLSRNGIVQPDEKSDGDSDSDIENETAQSSGSNEKWTYSRANKLVTQALEAILNGKELKGEPKERDETAKLVVTWCIELWFLIQVKKCTNAPVVVANQDISKKLLGRYVEITGESSRLHTLNEKDCNDVVAALKSLGDFVLQLNVHLGDPENRKRFNDSIPSQRMLKIYNKFLNLYLIPRSGNNRSTRPYGFFSGGFKYYDWKEEDEAAEDEALDDEAIKLKSDEEKLKVNEEICQRKDLAKVKKGFRKAGLWTDKADKLYNVLKIDPRQPSDALWTPEAFCKELGATVKKIQDDCSLLVLALSCHGWVGHICGSDKVSGMAVTKILKTICTDKLKFIPKVLIIQACQDGPGSEGHHIKDDMAKEEELGDVHLIMTCSPDEIYLANTELNFTKYFARYIGKADGKTTISEIADKAIEKECKKRKEPKRTLNEIPTKRTIFPPGAGVGHAPAGDEEEEEDTSDSDA